MSVIHQMLKKLDERGQGRAPGAAVPARSAAAARWRLPLIVLAGGGAIGVAALADLPQPAMPGSVPAPPMMAGAESTEATPVRTAPVEPPAAGLRQAQPEPAPAQPERAPAQSERAPAQSERAPAQPERTVAQAARIAEAPALPVSLAVPLPSPVRIDKRNHQFSPAQRAAHLHREATDLAQTGQRRAAIERALEALVADPRHAPSRLLAAVLEHELGASGSAAALLQEGLALQPGDAQLALLLARIQVAQGDAGAALATLELNAAGGAEAEGLRGGILAQQGRFQAALPAYESAARQQPGNPMWWFGLGVALDAEGFGPKARLAFARAQQLGLQREDLQQFVDQRLRQND